MFSWSLDCNLPGKGTMVVFQGGKSGLMCDNVTLRDGAFDKMEIQSL